MNKTTGEFFSPEKAKELKETMGEEEFKNQYLEFGMGDVVKVKGEEFVIIYIDVDKNSLVLRPVKAFVRERMRRDIQSSVRKRFRKIGRNEICPQCKSGKKYKKCCGRNV